MKLGWLCALHLEDRHPAVADVDDAGVLARPLEHARPRGGELAQVDLRRLVGAVLGPQGGGDAELGPARLAAEDLARRRSYSSAVRPCRAPAPASTGRLVAAAQRSASAVPIDTAAALAEPRPRWRRARGRRVLPSTSSDAALRVGHQAEHVAGLVADAGDGARRAVGVRRRPCAAPSGRRRSGRPPGRRASSASSAVRRVVVVALAVGDRHAQHLAGAAARG